jgi:hypothetical protein
VQGPEFKTIVLTQKKIFGIQSIHVIAKYHIVDYLLMAKDFYNGKHRWAVHSFRKQSYDLP